MDKMKLVSGKLLMCISEIAVGTLLLINPVGFAAVIIKLGGVVLLLIGIIASISYFRTDPEDAQKEQGLVRGISFMIAGLFCILRTEWFIVTFPLMTIVYGIIILFTGIVRIQWAVDMLRMKTGRWYIAAIGAALSLILAAVILNNPFSTTAILWMFTAVSLIVEAIADLLVLVFMRSNGDAE